ncbi:MAG TPA: cell division protein ZapA [Burkholderiaceae bacterium]|nr:cell division protein ZapA [Burkholderiaceae bacterium]
MPATEQVTLTLLGREYVVSCAPEERETLLACARYVAERMEALRDSGRVLGADRIAVLTALQIAQELFSARSGDGIALGSLRRRLQELNHLADEMLAPQEKLF